MRKFGLIGFPLSHSFSKKFFTEKFENEGIAGCEYELFPLSHISKLEPLLSAQPELEGFNVTIPYKLEVIPFLHKIDEAAEAIGAVNCVSIEMDNGNRRLHGFNTDAYGFEASLTPLLAQHHAKALVLGNGGAAKAVVYVLRKLGIPVQLVSRTGGKDGVLSYLQVTETVLNSHRIIVNTTPLGMTPNTNSFPDLPYQFLSPEHLIYDLVYNPEETLFLSKSRKQGAKTKNGLEMLYLQAERSWHIWNR